MRNIPADVLAEYTSKSVQPVYIIEAFFDTGTLRLFTGYGVLNWNGETFFGGGNLIGISPIEETQDIQAKGLIVNLNGIPSNLVAIALGERSRGRHFRLYLGFVTTGNYIAVEDSSGYVELEDESGFFLLENQLVDLSPYRIFSGLMDVMEISDNGQESNIKCSVENVLITGRRTKLSRYTQEDQQKRYPSDKGLNFINQLQDKEVVW